jgi:hypothetical protein
MGQIILQIVTGLLILAGAWGLGRLFAAKDAQRRRGTLGSPAQGEPNEGEIVTFCGVLQTGEETTQRFEDGAPCAAATVTLRSRYSGAAGEGPTVNACAPELWLKTDAETRVPLLGPLRVVVGSREVPVHTKVARLTGPLAKRLLSAGPPADALLPEERVEQARSLAAGDRLLVEGVAEQRADAASEAGYRETAGGWSLSAPQEGALLAAYAGRPALPLLGGWRALLPGLLLLGLGAGLMLPAGLGKLGQGLGEKVNDTLRDCEEATGTARWADRLFLVQGAVPFWGSAAHKNRGSLLGGVINGVKVCLIGSKPPKRAFLDRAIAFVTERLPAVDPEPARYRPRWELEELLHELGRDQEMQQATWSTGCARTCTSATWPAQQPSGASQASRRTPSSPRVRCRRATCSVWPATTNARSPRCASASKKTPWPSAAG